MTHFPVAVFTAHYNADIADHDAKLDTIFAPYDEAISVDPYVDRTWTESDVDEARTHAKERNVTGFRGLDRRAVEAGGIDDDVAFLRDYTGQKVVRRTAEDGSTVYDTYTTYNPKSKWDWYIIGGRFSGIFSAKPGITPSSPDIIPVVDLDTDISEVTGAMSVAYDDFVTATEGLKRPTRTPNQIVEEDGIERDVAQEVYEADPWVIAASKVEVDHKVNKNFMSFWSHLYWKDSKDDHLATFAATDIPTAWIDLDGNWHEIGPVGWFGMIGSSDEQTEAEYNAEYRTYRDSLPEGAHVTVVDCHI